MATPPKIGRRIQVAFSVGEGVDQPPLPGPIESYRRALEAAGPTYVAWSSVLDSVRTQIFLAAMIKNLSVGAGAYGLTLDWNPTYHAIDPVNPRLWDPVEYVGVMFEATDTGGQIWQLGFSVRRP